MLSWIISILIALVVIWVDFCFIYALWSCNDDILDIPGPVLWTLLIVLIVFVAGVFISGVFVVHEAIEWMMGIR